MVIVCEKCHTRFDLDESRVPAQGARVRCSRCQHRFHVKPPAPRLDPDEIAARAIEHNAPEPDLPDTVLSGASPEIEEDPDLDNPEFLFDRPEGEPPAQSRAARFREDEPLEEPEPVPLLPIGASDDTVSPLLGMAPGSLLSEPDPAELAENEESRRFLAPLTRLEDVTGVGDGLDDDFNESSGVFGAELTPARGGAAPAKEAGGSRAAAIEDWDDLDSDLPDDPLLRPRGNPPASQARPAPAAPELLRAQTGPAVAETSESVAGLPQRAPASSLLRTCAVVAGLLLAAAGGRALWIFSLNAPQAPSVVRGDGWSAFGVEAEHRADADGRRVLVLRGRLESEGNAWLPPVWAQRVDGEGAPVGVGAYAEHVWLDGVDLSPDEISRRLASLNRAPVPAPAQRENRFTLLLPDPPGTATSYRLELGELAGVVDR